MQLPFYTASFFKMLKVEYTIVIYNLWCVVQQQYMYVVQQMHGLLILRSNSPCNCCLHCTSLDPFSPSQFYNAHCVQCTLYMLNHKKVCGHCCLILYMYTQKFWPGGNFRQFLPIHVIGRIFPQQIVDLNIMQDQSRWDALSELPSSSHPAQVP